MKQSQTNDRKAYLFAGLTVFFWSTVATAFKIALQFQSPFELLLYAVIVSLIILLCILFVTGKHRQLFSFSPTEVFSSALLGFLNPFLYYLVLFEAYSRLPAQVAQPLNMVWPIVLVFLSIPILGQKISLQSIAALLISFAGVYFISSQGMPFALKIEEPLGVGLALFSSIIWSLFWLFNVRDKRAPEIKLFWNFAFSLLYLAIFLLITEVEVHFSWTAFLPAAYVGAFEMGFSFILWLNALRFASKTDIISQLIYLSPFISLIFIHLILGEQIYYTTITGIFLIILGIFFQKIRLSKKPNKRMEL